MANEDFKPTEQFHGGDDGRSESSEQLRNESFNSPEGLMASGYQPGDMRNMINNFGKAFSAVNEFIEKNMGSDGKLNVDNLTQDQIRDMLAINQRQLDAVTAGKQTVASSYEASTSNLKQFG